MPLKPYKSTLYTWSYAPHNGKRSLLIFWVHLLSRDPLQAILDELSFTIEDLEHSFYSFGHLSHRAKRKNLAPHCFWRHILKEALPVSRVHILWSLLLSFTPWSINGAYVRKSRSSTLRIVSCWCTSSILGRFIIIEFFYYFIITCFGLVMCFHAYFYVPSPNITLTI